MQKNDSINPSHKKIRRRFGNKFTSDLLCLKMESKWSEIETKVCDDVTHNNTVSLAVALC